MSTARGNTEPTISHVPEAVPVRFSSLASLRAAHTDLLKRHRKEGDNPAILTDIEQLMHRGHETGAVLDNEDDRWTAQGLLDYWSSVLYRAGQVEPPDTTLVEFDVSLAPELDDELCPYLGLEAFQAKNQHLFFGRQWLLEKLLNHLESHQLLVVMGSSGSGKSSVVLGGLLPHLVAGALPSSQDWLYYASLVPGADPLTALARRLKPDDVDAADWVSQQAKAFQSDSFHLLKLLTSEDSQLRDHRSVVLFVDQFEEVFTLCRNDAVRQAFVKNLVNFVQADDRSNRLILTMRTDFESQLMCLPDLSALFERSHIRVTAMDASELRAAIVDPADLVGLKFEEGLVDALLGDVLGEPTALPLLQFTLLKLWDHRERNRVTWAAYRRLGGGREALARSADALYDGLILEEQVTMKRILLRMVRPGEGLEVTSSRIPYSALFSTGEANDRVARVLRKLIDACLVRLTEGDMPSAAQVEVAHEALIRNWPRLVDWLEDERIRLRQRLRLTASAEQWEHTNRDSSALFSGVLLEDARGYEDLNALETEFVQTSIQRVEKQKQNAERTIQQLEQQKEIAEILEASARAKNWFDTPNAALGLTLAISTAHQSRQSSAEVFTATMTTVSNSLLLGLQMASEKNRLIGHTDNITSVAFSFDGQRIVSSSSDGTIGIWDAETGQMIGDALTGHSAGVASVAFSPNGQRIVSGSLDRTVRIWDAITGQPIGKPLTGHTNYVLTVAFSPDGQRMISGSSDGSVRTWDVETGSPVGNPLTHEADVSFAAFSPNADRVVCIHPGHTLVIWNALSGHPAGEPLMGHADVIQSVAFSPNGRLIVSGSRDRTVRIWDASTGRPVGIPLTNYRGSIMCVAFSADGRSVVSGSLDGTVSLWDVATSQPMRLPLIGHTDLLTSVAFSPDGQCVISGSWDKTLRIWDVSTGRKVGNSLIGHSRDVTSVAFSPNSRRVVSGSWDKTLRIWDADTGKLVGEPLRGHQSVVTSVTFSADGRSIVSSSLDKTLRLWDTDTGLPLGEPLSGHERSVLGVVFSLDGQRLISASADKSLRVWTVGSNSASTGRVFAEHTDALTCLDLSPDGQCIACGSRDNTVLILDAQTGEQKYPSLRGHTSEVWWVAFSPDGQFIISGSWDTTVRIWNMRTGKPVRVLTGHNAPVEAVMYSPDGRRIVSSSRDRTLRIWNALTGEEICMLSGHQGIVYSVSFSPDGRRLVSGGTDATVRFWEGDCADWMCIACDRLKYHPLLNAPETILSDEKLINAAKRARLACRIIRKRRVPHRQS